MVGPSEFAALATSIKVRSISPRARRRRLMLSMMPR